MSLCMGRVRTSMPACARIWYVFAVGIEKAVLSLAGTKGQFCPSFEVLSTSITRLGQFVRGSTPLSSVPSGPLLRSEGSRLEYDSRYLPPMQYTRRRDSRNFRVEYVVYLPTVTPPLLLFTAGSRLGQPCTIYEQQPTK